jgi:transcriptional regulator with XRE-family HTH domain
MNFRKELKRKLKKKNLSISKLSRLADINHNTIYTYLQGKTSISADNLEKLFKVLEKNCK